MTDTMREAFEKWAESKGYRTDTYTEVPDDYWDDTTQSAWRAWQAAQSVPEEKLDFEKLESLGWQIAICAMCGTHASAIKPVQSVPVMGEPVFCVSNNGMHPKLFYFLHDAESFRYENQKSHDLSGSLAHFRIDHLYRKPTTSITAAELESLRKAAVPEWQPIDTAPKDSTVILLALPKIGALRFDDARRVYEGRWDDTQDTFTSVNGFILLGAATHWMPLPTAPAAKEEK